MTAKVHILIMYLGNYFIQTCCSISKMKYSTDKDPGPFLFGKYLTRAWYFKHKRGTNIAKAVVSLPLYPLELVCAILDELGGTSQKDVSGAADLLPVFVA